MQCAWHPSARQDPQCQAGILLPSEWNIHNCRRDGTGWIEDPQTEFWTRGFETCEVWCRTVDQNLMEDDRVCTVIQFERVSPLAMWISRLLHIFFALFSVGFNTLTATRSQWCPLCQTKDLW